MSWRNYADKVRRYFPFSGDEWGGFALLVFVFALTFSFGQWGVAEFDLQEGLKNLLLSMIFVALAVFVHHSAQRLLALWHGYRAEHRVWWTGLLVGLLALFLSNGQVMIFAASSVHVQFMPVHRLGSWRYGLSLRHVGRIAFAGPIAVLVFGLLMNAISPVFADLFKFCVLFAVYSMIPIPPLDGAHVFFGAQTTGGGTFWYLTLVCGFMSYFLLYLLTPIGFWLSLLFSFVLGIVGWLIFYLVTEG